jgi:hypothetical protein
MFCLGHLKGWFWNFSSFQWHALHTFCWSVLDFWKIKFEKSSLKNQVRRTVFLAYTGSKSLVWKRLKIQFIELDFSKLIFQKSRTDQQGDRSLVKFSTFTKINRKFLQLLYVAISNLSNVPKAFYTVSVTQS